MFPNPGAVNNLLRGRYREPTFVGAKRIVATGSMAEYPLALNTISGIAPGDLCWFALSKHLQSQGISGGDGGWQGISYPYTSPIFTSVVYWWKAGLTANDIANTKVRAFGGLNEAIDILVWRNAKRAVLRTDKYWSNGRPDTPPPLKIPAFTRSSDALGVFAHLFSSNYSAATMGPMKLQPANVTMNARIDDFGATAQYKSFAADMLNTVSLFGQEVQAALPSFGVGNFLLGTYWELRAT